MDQPGIQCALQKSDVLAGGRWGDIQIIGSQVKLFSSATRRKIFMAINLSVAMASPDSFLFRKKLVRF